MIRWQWHQLYHILITCTSLLTNNHASTSSLDNLQAQWLSWCSSSSVKAHCLQSPIVKQLSKQYRCFCCRHNCDSCFSSSHDAMRASCSVNCFSWSLQIYRAIQIKLEMWANAQADGRPAEYRWRPLFNAAKFGWRPLLECHAVTVPI